MKKVFVVAVAVICLTLLPNLISCRKQFYYGESVYDDIDLDKDLYKTSPIFDYWF